MKNVFSDYLKYTTHIDEYNSWTKSNTKSKNKTQSSAPDDFELLKQKAKVLTEPILIYDSYVHEKAEDSETFFQTFNIELMSAAGVIASLPAVIQKTAPFLEKYSDKSKIVKNSALLLEKYKNKTFSVFKKNIPLSKVAGIFTLISAGAVFAGGMKHSMQSQLGLIRKASFDASQNIINDPKLFAILTPEQEKQVNSIVDFENKNNSDILNKLKDKMDINSSFRSVKDYKLNKDAYEKKKQEYFENMKQQTPKQFSSEQKNNAESDKELFENLLKNVEHDVLEPLRKVETLANISYSALFTGGFLEYLVSDKLVKVLHVKNKPMQCLIKFGAPLLTYLLLNKNISDIENKAILATKYKHLKKFADNPKEYASQKESEKQTFPQFLKTVCKDMKDYEKFSKEELPIIKQKSEAKKQINLSDNQRKDAELLQKNTSMVLNNHQDKVYEQTVGIKTLSETILSPIDVLATALGAKLGSNLAKKFPNNKHSGLFMGIGAVITFIPAAITEAKLTKQQKSAEKIAAMLAIKDMDNISQFMTKNKNTEFNFNSAPSIFKEFIK